MHVQVYSEVLPLLPEVQYNAPARILTFRASGSRKQPRLPGEPSVGELSLDHDVHGQHRYPSFQ